MASTQNLFLAIISFAALAATGCVGPMACGPAGCDASGPIARNTCDGCDGCGELYIDPWINEPAEACDPCDACGNYNGQSCGKCRSIFSGLACLWGYRYDGGGACGDCGLSSCGGCGAEAVSCDGCAGGCDSCDGGGYVGGHMGQPLETFGPGASMPPGVPTPVPENSLEIQGDVEIVPSGEPEYQPRRTRQIFRNRGGADTEMPPSRVR